MVVDDHELLRAGTRRILDQADGYYVVGEAGNGEDALQVIADVEPDVVLVDIKLPTINGIELARRIAADFPKVVVLILSAYDDENYVRAALAAGVAGYLLKTMASDELIRSIGAACDGFNLIERGPAGRGETSGSRVVGSPRLTGREQEVVRLVARGMTNKAIARQLGISPRTVEGHLNHVFDKLQTTSRTELVHYALASSLFGAERAAGRTGTHPMSRAAVRGMGVPLGRTERSGRSEGSNESGPKAAAEDDNGSAPDRSVSSNAPWSNSTFWILQLVVLSLYLIRLAATVAFHLDSTSQALEFSTLAVFLVPVVYATLNFGLQGALCTAGWVTVLAVPRFLTAVHSHNYQAAWAELAQIVLLDALALLVGQRVTAERDARRVAEAAQKAHLNAEARYRDLFFSNQAPILIVNGDGYVVETNASAQRAFSISSPKLAAKDIEAAAPVRLVDIIGPVASGHILTRLISEQLPRLPGDHGSSTTDDRVEPLTFELDGTPVVYRPTATMLNRSDDGTRMQIVLEDVTSETRRHDLMEAYAAHVVSGQEEERRHIAQEIHDGPVQALIHLCRQIDLASSRAGIDPERAHADRGSADHRRRHSGRASFDRQGPATIGPRRPGLGRLDRPGPVRGRDNGTTSRRHSPSPELNADWLPRSSWHSFASPRRRYRTSSGMRSPIT